MPVLFGSGSVSFNFTDMKTHAFGENLKLISGKYVIYSGDINQDGAIDGLDMISIDNEAAVFASGYIPEDINGDSVIDALDMILLDNNAAEFASKITP
jgi:hypothetical protein